MEAEGEIYLDLMSHWKKPEELVLGAREPRTLLRDRNEWPPFKDFTHLMMYLDMMAYLPDDIMVKVDRASMAVSRNPVRRFWIIGWWNSPGDFPCRTRSGMERASGCFWEVLYKYVPRELVERPKKGFGVPIAAWLRGPLKDWAEALLDEKRLREEGFLNGPLVRQKWHEHLSGIRNWHYYLWDILMFQAWLESQR